MFERWKEVGASFASIDKNNTDLSLNHQNSIVGGPSTFFPRHHEVEKSTFVEILSNLVRKHVGLMLTPSIYTVWEDTCPRVPLFIGNWTIISDPKREISAWKLVTRWTHAKNDK